MPLKPSRWGWYESVNVCDIRQRWPQLIYASENRQLYCPKRLDKEANEEYDILVLLATCEINYYFKPCDFIPAIRRFNVAIWPKPEEVNKTRIKYNDLSAHQKQVLAYLVYWLGLNNRPLSPKKHAPISTAYDKICAGMVPNDFRSIRFNQPTVKRKPGE